MQLFGVFLINRFTISLIILPFLTHCDSPHTFGVRRVNSWVPLAPDYSGLPCDVSTACEGWSVEGGVDENGFVIFQTSEDKDVLE